MQITYIHHSGFLVETGRFYYLFDYESRQLPPMDGAKPVFVLSSHSHSDHYRAEVFPLLEKAGMRSVHAVLSDDICPPENLGALSVAPLQEYTLAPGVKLTTFRSTDLGVAFLVEEDAVCFYHAGDLNDWVWAEESDCYNQEMTENYRQQIDLLSRTLGQRTLDAAFVILDPRQEQDYDRGLCYFLQTVSAKQVYPMHFWDDPSIIQTFLNSYPQYAPQLQITRSN